MIISASKYPDDRRDVLIMTSRDLVTVKLSDAASFQSSSILPDLEIKALTTVYILRHMTVCP
jgi:hypothetical protein